MHILTHDVFILISHEYVGLDVSGFVANISVSRIPHTTLRGSKSAQEGPGSLCREPVGPTPSSTGSPGEGWVEMCVEPVQAPRGAPRRQSPTPDSTVVGADPSTAARTPPERATAALSR